MIGRLPLFHWLARLRRPRDDETVLARTLPAWLLDDLNLGEPPGSDFLSADSIRYRKHPRYPSF